MSSSNFGDTKDNDSAILVLDESSSNVRPSLSTPSQLDGHQILEQVKQELQFVPSVSENAYVTGAMNSTQAVSSNAGSVVITTSMEHSRANDTDFLVGNMGGMDDPISLGSPVFQPGKTPEDSSHTRTKFSVWQLEYYARYFDLTANVFFRRVLWSFLPLTGGNKGTYIDRHIQSNPDLFGPVWISLTLVYVISMCNDILGYYNSAAANMPGTLNRTDALEHHHLQFRFARVNILTMITFTYVFVVPIVLWSFCQWRQCSKMYTFLECLSAYGYSLSIFIPVTILSLVNVREVQFILFVSAEFLSGTVLLISFAPVVHSDPSRSFKFAYVMLIFILAAHFLLGLLYMYAFL